MISGTTTAKLETVFMVSVKELKYRKMVRMSTIQTLELLVLPALKRKT